jgi:hypothetical protein
VTPTEYNALQERILGAKLNRSRLRLPLPVAAYFTGQYGDLAGAIAECDASGMPVTIAEIQARTGIAASLLEEFMVAGQGTFGLAGLDAVRELERERNRRLVRLACETLTLIADEADGRTFDVFFASLLDGRVLDAIAGTFRRAA